MKRKSFIRSLIAVPAMPKIAGALSVKAATTVVDTSCISPKLPTVFDMCMNLQHMLDNSTLSPLHNRITICDALKNESEVLYRYNKRQLQ